MKRTFLIVVGLAAVAHGQQLTPDQMKSAILYGASFNSRDKYLAKGLKRKAVTDLTPVGFTETPLTFFGAWDLGRDARRRKPPQKERKGPARDSAYLAYIRSLPCLTCQSSWIVEAAHVGSDGGQSQKCSDYATVPLCARCHRTGPHAYHGLNSSAAEFERRHGLDLRAEAARLYRAWRRAA